MLQHHTEECAVIIVGGGVLVAQSCLTLRPHGLQPTRLLCPGDFPGKDPGVGCHFLLQDTHRWGDPKKGGWRWEPQHQETWSQWSWSKLFQPRGSKPFGCRSHSLTAGGPAWIWRSWADAEKNRLTSSMGQGSLAGLSSPAPSAP